MWKQTLLLVILTLIPCGLFIGFIPSSTRLYYLMLIGMSVYSVLRSSLINIPVLVLVIASMLSILIGNPPTLFKSEERLALFILLLVAIFPVLESEMLYRFRNKLFTNMMYVCVFAGVSALFCYLLGINYMTRYYGITHANINTAGVFSGITTHSMMLGPVSAMGLVYLIYWATKEKIQPKIKGLSLLGVALSGCAILLSASRISLASALTGIAVVILLRFKYKIIKLIGVILCSIIVLILTFPLYKPIAMPMIEKQANNLDTGGTFHSREDRWGHRLSEFGSSPMFGIGFSAVDTQYKGEYSASHGFIEPGSSWLAVLSMLGLFGTLPIAYILIVTIVRLKRIYSRSIEDYSILLLGLLSVFFVHLIAEGYILAGGSFLCYLFWLTLGVSYSYSRIDLND